MHAKRIMGVSLMRRIRRANDMGDDGVHAGVAGRVVGDDLALTQDDDAVGDREHVGQSVADQDDGNAVPLESPDEIEHMFDLPHGKRSGWLVHDDELGVEGERAGDRHRLLLAAG